MTTKGFRDSGYREELHRFLISDAGREAISLLEKKPSELPAINGIHHTDAVVARMYAFNAGMNNCLSQLRELAEPWVDASAISQASEREQFSDYVPPTMRDAFQKYLQDQQASLQK